MVDNVPNNNIMPLRERTPLEIATKREPTYRQLVSTLLRDPTALEHASIHRSLLKARPYFQGLILDDGCGARPYEEMVRQSGAQYIGMDVEARGVRGPDVIADSLDLPFANESFDTILSTQVLEHVKDPFRMILEAARVLKHRGHLVVTAPMTWPLHEEPYDYFRFTRFGLEALVRNAGLTCVCLEERSGGWEALAQLLALTLYDLFGKNRLARVLSKLLMLPLIFLATLLDKLLPYRKLTLGYLLIARK